MIKILVISLILVAIHFLSGCMAWNENAGIALGTDIGKLDHEFGESISMTKVDNSTAFVKAADETGDIVNGYFVKEVAMGWIGNEKAATDGANAVAGKRIDADVAKSAQQVDLEKTKMLLEVAE